MGSSAAEARPILSNAELHQFNREPVSFLADIGSRCGVPYDVAFYEAQDLVLAYGSSRRIEYASGCELCERMRRWAAQRLNGAARS
jgi:hypothetical protein